jgi:hypothetical protein
MVNESSVTHVTVGTYRPSFSELWARYKDTEDARCPLELESGERDLCKDARARPALRIWYCLANGHYDQPVQVPIERAVALGLSFLRPVGSEGDEE